MNQDHYNNKLEFCPAPWNAIYISSAGEVDSCCISSNQLGNINQTPLEDIIHGEKNYNIKHKMIIGKPVTGCNICYSKNNDTLRTIYLKFFKETPLTFYDSANNFKLNYLDLRWRNTCNSACVYCGPKDSSLWAEELGIATPVDNTQLDKLKMFISPRLTQLQEVYLAGGEPLLIKENEWFLENLLEHNPDCKLLINSNLSHIDNKIFNLITKFKNVRWLISGESVGKRYEYIRYGSIWETFIKNVNTLKNYFDPKVISLQMVYHALNTHSIFDYIDFMSSLDIPKETMNVYFYCGGSGGNLDPRNLPNFYIQQALETLDKHIDHSETHYNNNLKTIKNILQTPYAGNTQNLYNDLYVLDNRRNLDSKLIFPEIYQYKDL